MTLGQGLRAHLRDRGPADRGKGQADLEDPEGQDRGHSVRDAGPEDLDKGLEDQVQGLGCRRGPSCGHTDAGTGMV